MEEEAPAMEEFQVDDLLDLRGLPEPEKDGEEDDDDASKRPAFFALEKAAAFHVSEISLPEETEAANLEWLSRFVDDCHSEYLPAVATVAGKNTACFPAKQTCLWSRGEAAGSRKKESFFPAKAKRSNRRRRPCAFWSLSGTSPASSAFSSVSPSSSSSSSVFYEQHVSPEKTHVPKKRGRKPKIPTDGVAAGERRCTHCGVQKTPQWRAGPHGPKTLCNACGVRFKSGRLLPEYRPACSPTFVSDVHSNSHRKVLEMRQKKEVRPLSTAPPAVQSC